MARIYFRCPHCGADLVRPVDTRIGVENGKHTLQIRCQDGICRRCARGMHLVICAGVEAMSEHELRQDGRLFRQAERLRQKLGLHI